jgi:hypothetical protein
MAEKVVSGEGQGGMVLSYSGEESDSDKRSGEESEEQQSGASGQDDEVEFETIDLGLDDESEEDAEEEDTLTLEPEEKDKGEPRIPKSRLDKQRDKFTKQIQKLEADLESAKQPSEVEQKFLELYGRFADPIETVAADLRFMDTIESLKTDPEVKAAIGKVMAKMEGKQLPETETRTETAKEVVDPRIDKLVHQEKGRRVSEFLRDARVDPKGEWWKPLRKEMLSSANDIDIDDLDDETLVKIAKSSLKELGWTAKQVQGQRRSKGSEEPPTGAIKSAARSRVTGDDAKKADDEPKTVRDWDEQGRRLIKERLASRASP